MWSRGWQTRACFCQIEMTCLKLARNKSGGSSQRWLERQRKDPFVKQARTDAWRCRSAYKLLQIDDRYSLLKPGHVVVDCGAAPGSWTQVAVQRVKAREGRGAVIAIDILPMHPLEGATVLDQCDFTAPSSQKRLMTSLPRKADVVLSDMAPNATGNRELDHDVLIEMAQSVLRFARAVLKPGGTFLCKLWQGSGRTGFEKDVETFFEKVNLVKPEASRKDSAEMYVLGRGYKGIKKG